MPNVNNDLTDDMSITSVGFFDTPQREIEETTDFMKKMQNKTGKRKRQYLQNQVRNSFGGRSQV